MRNNKNIKTISMLLMIVGLASFSSCTNNEGNNLEKIAIKNTNMQNGRINGFKTNIEKATLENKNFRKVIYTSRYCQLVLMNLKPKEEIGEEIHPDIDQFFRFESGNGKCIINEKEYDVKDGDAIIIPAGAKHNIINTDNTTELKVYTIYSPPHHKDGIVRKTKKEAETSKEEFDGVTTERF